MRLLVTGASGLLGLHLGLRAADRHAVTGVVHAHPLVGVPFRVVQADLSSEAAVQAVIAQAQPDAIVHAAALPYPERCEENPELSERLNAKLPEWVARCAQQAGIRLLHISTDAVFDGVRGDFSETDIPSPRNTYARHKLAGERAVLEANPAAVIVRTVFYGWSLNGQRSLAEWFYNNLRLGIPVQGFTDALFCPLEAGDLGNLLVSMLERGLSGLYHVVSPEAINKYDFGVSIARRFGLDEKLIAPASVADCGLKAPRSANLSLRCDKLVHDLGIRPPGQAEELEKWYQQWCDGTAERIQRMGSAERMKDEG
jgi:dTDP-4-dehydrorhamnose reductase